MSPSTDPHILHPGHAPTPFTAGEIQAGCPTGRTIRLLVEESGGTLLRVIRFVTVDDDGADQESTVITTDGDPVGEPSLSRSGWVELQEHASFPEEATTIESETLNSPLGRLECRVYTVTGDDATRFWFDTSRPGMPVKVDSRVNGENAYTMTMLEDVVI